MLVVGILLTFARQVVPSSNGGLQVKFSASRSSILLICLEQKDGNSRNMMTGVDLSKVTSVTNNTKSIRQQQN